MKLVSLKLTKPESMQESPSSCEVEGPTYPYGMCLYLDDLTLEKLGMSATDFEIGQEIALTGVGKVTGLSVREREGGEKYSSVDIQITDVSVEEEAAPAPMAKTVGGRLYGEG